MKKKKYISAALIGAFALSLLSACGKENETTTDAATEAPKTEAVSTEAATTPVTEASTEPATEPETEKVTEPYTPEEPDEYVKYPTDAEYHLVWEENFDYAERKLPRTDWDYEIHKPGWVNRELQAYADSEEYAYVEKGELVIRPVKEVDDNGNVTYTSGRVNTMRRHDFTYGRFEAKIKVPNGNGFLPAFWMMPTSSTYGSWPLSGEIDIMEILGNDPTKQHGTIHYGDPHGQQQGSFSNGSDFSKEYHVFAVEWEPGLIRWYVDGEAFYETSDWFSASATKENPYPAPFNHPFHIILNVAVGGNWPGDPDPDQVFDESTCMYVDYVRVYQKDSYDENVTKPEKVVTYGEPDSTGNYIRNSDFADAEDLGDDKDWVYQNLNSGVGTAEIKDNEIKIKIDNEGLEDYSIQLVQAGLPAEKGKKYKLSFEARGEDQKTLITAITGPDVNYTRYLDNTKVDLTGDWSSYSFEYEMKEASDGNARVEFNIGRQGTGTAHIRNVRYEEVK